MPESVSTSGVFRASAAITNKSQTEHDTFLALTMAKKRAGRESGGTVDTREKAQSEPKSAKKAEPAEDEEPEAMKGMGRYIIVAMQAVLVFIV